MKIAIKDANIIFDLFDMELLDEFLSLDYHFITSDFVQSEIKSPETKKKFSNLIKKKKIKIESLSFEELEEADKMKKYKSGLSMHDCSVIFLAEKYKAILLSGDKAIRSTAKIIGIEYHGILWALDKLIEQQIITSKAAKEKLTYLMSINNRLPQKECQKRIDRWSR